MKKGKYLLAAFLISVFCVSSAAAKSIGIQVIQKNGALNEVHSSSYLIEESVLDSFFDYGYIVSNSPVCISNGSNDESNERKTLNEAFEGQLDYVIFITVSYKAEGSTNPQADYLTNIERISWKMVDVITKRTLADATYNVGKVNPQNNSGDGIRKYTKNIAADIFDVVKSVR